MTTRTTWDRALITGASSGIGDALARRLAAAGTDLVVVARNEVRLQALATELRAAHGVDVEVLAADLGDAAQRTAVEARVASDERPVDLLVNNAGYGFSGRFGEIPVDDEDAEIQVNVVATMRLCHAAVARWQRSSPAAGDGHLASGRLGGIMNLSSIAAFQPTPTTATYGATKAFILEFSQSLHEELKELGVVVTVLCPGLTKTEFQERGNHEIDGPDFIWQTADEVAAVGLDGLAKGRAVVVSGVLNKSLQVGGRLLPMSVARRVAGQVLRSRR